MQTSGVTFAITLALAAIALGVWLSNPNLNHGPGRATSMDSLPAEELPQRDYEALHEYIESHSRSELRWGTYHSGLYYGIRSRTYPDYVAAGLLWASHHEDVSQLRHWCRQEDRLQKYGWLQHDGRAYGYQTIEDQHNRMHVQTHYVRVPEHAGWASRFMVSHLEPRDERLRRQPVEQTRMMLYFYVDLGCGDENIEHPCRKALQGRYDVRVEPTECESTQRGWSCLRAQFESSEDPSMTASDSEQTENAPLNFELSVEVRAKQPIKIDDLRFSGMKDANVVNVKDRILQYVERVDDREEVILDNIIDEEATMLVVQAVIDAPVDEMKVADNIVLDVVFREGDKLGTLDAPVKELISDHIEAQSIRFDDRFEDVFGLSAKEFNASQIEFAKAAFSNLMGGVGYFYGSPLVQIEGTESEVEELSPYPLFTAIPSRSFFPRGFLWDEGFHQLGIMPFDEELTRDVLAHWMGSMQDDGYIAREQILGSMAQKRVPTEFLVQYTEHANPPSLLLCLEKMIEKGVQDEKDVQFIKLVYPFIERWYRWFLTTQAGPRVDDGTTFRWRGRRVDDGKLIANTLSSGLDDYPRASFPTTREMHVDLLCWMIRASDILTKLAEITGHKEHKSIFQANRARYLESLDRFHWSELGNSFFDIGDHSEDGHIEHQVVVRCRDEQGNVRDTTAPLDRVRTRNVRCPASHPMYLFPLGDGQGGLKLQPVFIPGTMRLQHVRHVGYVSLFPLLLKVLPPDSAKLKALLDQLRDPAHLWSPYGLRSLSTTDAFYERENAAGDNPYWRGSIWINMNYLALDALHHYSQAALDSPYRQDFQQVYTDLRKNVMDTIYSEYMRTGYLWEQYNGNVHAKDAYGKGQRCHPFSGWTALVVNIMAEKY